MVRMSLLMDGLRLGHKRRKSQICNVIISRIGIYSFLGSFADGWLCWAYFATPSDEVEQDPELRDEMEETLREFYGHLEGSFPDKVIPPGRNPAVDCIRLTLDPINSEHRPLAFYFVNSHIVTLILGCVPPSSSCVDPFPNQRIHLLSQCFRCPRGRRILVPSANVSRPRSSSINDNSRCRFRPLPNLVRHSPRSPSPRPSNLHSRPQKRKHASPSSHFLPQSPRNDLPNKQNPRPPSPAIYKSNLLWPLLGFCPHRLDPEILPRQNRRSRPRRSHQSVTTTL